MFLYIDDYVKLDKLTNYTQTKYNGEFGQIVEKHSEVLFKVQVISDKSLITVSKEQLTKMEKSEINKEDICSHKDKYLNVLSINLKFYVCPKCGKDWNCD